MYSKYFILFGGYKEMDILLGYLSDIDKDKISNMLEEISKTSKENFTHFYNEFPTILRQLINSRVDIKLTKYDALLDEFLYEVDGYIYTKTDLQKKIIYDINWDDVIFKIKEKYL